jgi:hypothetical protein
MHRRLLVGIAGVAMLVTATVAPVAANDHSKPGTPGTANCLGQSTAYIAQGAHGFRGIGNLDSVWPAETVKQLKAEIRDFCSGG